MARAATDAEVLAVAEASGADRAITQDDLETARMKVWIAREYSRRMRQLEGEVIDWREGSGL